MNEKLILIVEDDDDLRYLATQQLKKIGFQSEAAKNGQDAIAKLKTQKYDLILMDVMMPVLDGVSATKLIRELEHNSGAHTIIIAMTAISDKERCLNAGMDDYIFKPIMLEPLKEIVTKWFNRTRLT